MADLRVEKKRPFWLWVILIIVLAVLVYMYFYMSFEPTEEVSPLPEVEETVLLQSNKTGEKIRV